MSEPAVDLWTCFGLDGSEAPERIIIAIQNDVERFLKAMAREEPATVILEGRKASFLVSHMNTRLEERGFVLQMLRYNRLDNTFFHGRLPTHRPTIVLTDSIHEGNKMTRSLTYLIKSGVKVRDVYSYLSATKGLMRVYGSRLLHKGRIYSHHLAADEHEYRRVLGGLDTYFNSRIEPMETEIPYDLYSVNQQLSRRNMVSLLRGCLKDTVGQGITSIPANNSRLPRSVWKVGFNVDRDSVSHWLDQASSDLKTEFSLNYVHVHFKMRNRNGMADFTIIPEIDLQSGFLKTKKGLRCRIFANRQCPVVLGSSANQQATCAACWGEAVAYVVLEGFHESVKQTFSERGLDWERKHHHLPLGEKLKTLYPSVKIRY